MLLVDRLLTDGCSPFFTPSAEGELDRAVRHAHAALLLPLMDLISIAIVLVAFAAFFAMLEGLDRV